MIRYNTLAVAAISLSLPLSANGDTEHTLWDSNHLYVGGTLGMAHSALSQQRVADRFAGLGYDFGVELDDRTRAAWGALLGYQWSRYFATEVGYIDMGSIDTRVSGRPTDIQRYLDSGANAHPQPLSGWELAALGTYPLGEYYYLYGRAGVLFSQAQTRADQVSAQSWNRSSEGPILGLGVGYRYNKHWRARLGLSYYDLDSQRTTFAGLSVIYQLGEPSKRATRTDTATHSEAVSTEPSTRRPDVTAEPRTPSRLDSTLTFAYNSTVVRDEFVPLLQTVAEAMHRNPERRLRLSGHSDNWGTSEYNHTLSEQRAKAVRDFMVTSFELEPERFELRAEGDTQPFVDNDTEEGRSLNRRVVLDWMEP